MKNVIKITIIIFFLCQLVYSQTKAGAKELSIGASYMSRSYENSDESWTAFNIPIRLGFCVTNNLEIEPELLFNKYEDEDAGLIFSVNFAYNINRPGQSNPTVPFLLGGVGFSNTIVILPNYAGAGIEDKNWTILNLGAGLKIFLAKPAALRLEYRFQKYNGSSELTYHNVLFGMSVFI